MTLTQQERKIFFEMFEEVLKKNGNSFTFFWKKDEYWAIIDDASYFEPHLSIDFVMTKRLIRVNFVIPNNANLFECLKSKREEIEAILGFKSEWVHGEKKRTNYRRIKNEFSFVPCNVANYNQAIIKAISIIIQYKKAFDKYIPKQP